MSFLKNFAKIFSTSTSTSTETASAYPSEQYKGFTITAQPLPDKGQFRFAALIEKETEEGQDNNQHHFIRSDTAATADLAAEHTVRKCKVFIDQMGDSIFS